MTSNREAKIQKLIQIGKDHCNNCAATDYEVCQGCKYYIFINERMKEIQDNGGTTEGI